MKTDKKRMKITINIEVPDERAGRRLLDALHEVCQNATELSTQGVQNFDIDVEDEA